MSGIARATSFLSNREKAADSDQNQADLKQRVFSWLLSALKQQTMIPLADIPKLSGLSAELALPIVGELIVSGKAEVVERSDRPGEKYLSLVR